MKIAILYQNTHSGSTTATKFIIDAIEYHHKKIKLFIYKQDPFFYSGFLSFTKNNIKAFFDFKNQLNSLNIQNTAAIYTSSYIACISHRFSKVKNIPLVFHYHGDQSITENEKEGLIDIRYYYTTFINKIIIFFQKYSLKHADVSVFVSKTSRDLLLKKYSIAIQKINAIVIPNGVDSKKFFPISYRKIQSIKRIIDFENKKIIMFSGRIDRKKGVDLIINALNKIKYKNILLIISHPKQTDKYSVEYKNTLKQIIKKNKLHKKVLFKENPTNLIELYQIADCVILPSQQEESPLVMFESLACGTPFLGTNVGNMKEVLSKINKKLVIGQNNAKYIAKKINWILKLNKEEKVNIRTKSNNLIKQHTWDKSAQKLLSAIYSISTTTPARLTSSKGNHI